MSASQSSPDLGGAPAVTSGVRRGQSYTDGRGRTRSRKNHIWTPADFDKLRLFWSELTVKQIAKRIGSTENTVYWRAQLLGLPLGCPQGMEYLSHAAKRTGFETVTLRGVLARAGVKIRRAQFRPNCPKRGRAGRGRLTYIVAPDAVDAAVEAWCAQETLSAAAARIGVRGETLARRLVNDPRVPPKPSGKRAWRIPSAIIDDIAAKHWPEAA